MHFGCDARFLCVFSKQTKKFYYDFKRGLRSNGCDCAHMIVAGLAHELVNPAVDILMIWIVIHKLITKLGVGAYDCFGFWKGGPHHAFWEGPLHHDTMHQIVLAFCNLLWNQFACYSYSCNWPWKHLIMNCHLLVQLYRHFFIFFEHWSLLACFGPYFNDTGPIWCTPLQMADSLEIDRPHFKDPCPFSSKRLNLKRLITYCFTSLRPLI